jgi:hypothetical protein
MSSKSSYLLKIPVSLGRAVERAAQKDGLSVEDWVKAALKRGIAVTDPAGYIRWRLGKPDIGDLREILDRVPDNPPMPGDEIPDDVKAKLRRA